MKKLLALILCVMMFVAVIPTSAFAHTYGDPNVDNPLYSATEYATQIKNMIKNTKSNIEKSYKFLAADQVVYGSAKAMDDMIVGLVDGIGNTLIEKELMKKAGVDGIKDNVRSYIDGAVAKKISENYYKALDKDGKRDPILYAQLVADSIQGALTDKDFQKGYEAVATYWALASLIKDTKDSLKDARKDFADSVDKKFQADFAKKYTALVDEYIDTLDTAATKAAANSLAWDILQAGLDGEKVAYNTNVATAKSNLDAAKTAAKTARDTDVTVTNTKNALSTAKTDLTLAEQALALEKLDPAATPASIAAKAAALATKEQAYATAQSNYNTAVASAQKTYEAAVDAAEDVYDYKVQWAQFNYDNMTAPMWETYNDSVETINPWGVYSVPNVGSWN